jgi:hypothetical protein
LAKVCKKKSAGEAPATEEEKRQRAKEGKAMPWNQPKAKNDLKGKGNAMPAALADKPKGKAVCYAFRDGKCERGDECRFSHASDHADSGAGSKSRDKSKDKGKAKGTSKGKSDAGNKGSKFKTRVAAAAAALVAANGGANACLIDNTPAAYAVTLAAVDVDASACPATTSFDPNSNSSTIQVTHRVMGDGTPTAIAVSETVSSEGGHSFLRPSYASILLKALPLLLPRVGRGSCLTLGRRRVFALQTRKARLSPCGAVTSTQLTGW